MSDLSIDYFLPYQKAWINDPSPMAIGEKSRRVGFTHAQAYAAVEGRIKGKSDYWHSSADMSASVEFIDECETWAKIFNAGAKSIDASEIIDDEAITTRQLVFTNGRKIVAGSSNPKFFRSKGGDAGLDEFAFHQQARELLKAAHATALFWGHRLRIWSTHNGEGSYFNQLVNQARGGQLKAAVQRVTILDAVEQGLVEKIKKLKQPDARARQEWLDDLHATCPDEQTWNEEYLCIPSADNASLLTYDLIRACEEPNLSLSEIESLPVKGTLYAGFDVGRKRDLSALWIIERVGDVFWTRTLRTLNKMNFTAQEDLLCLLMRNPAVKRMCIDCTGIGAMLAERLTDKFHSRVEAVNFTAPVKSDLAMPLLRLFQDRLVRIPSDATVRESLHKVRKIVTSSNNIRLDADRDEAGHADEFWALALAYHAADALRAPLPPPLLTKPMGYT